MMGSWTGFLNSRPPLVVFLASLSAFALTTFSLSVYVQQTDNLANPDVLDWNSLLSRFTRLNYCVPASNVTQLVLHNDNDNGTRKSVSLKVPSVSASFAEALFSAAKSKNHVKAQGQVQVQHLGRGLPVAFRNSVLDITIELENRQPFEACLTVEGPVGLLKNLKNDEEKCQKQHHENVNTALMAHSPDHLPHGWCQGEADASLTLEFDVVISQKNRPDWTVYVSSKDRQLIHLHLMVTSVFLFAILATVIIAIVVRGVAANSRKIQGDSRGDAHLVPVEEL